MDGDARILIRFSCSVMQRRGRAFSSGDGCGSNDLKHKPEFELVGLFVGFTVLPVLLTDSRSTLGMKRRVAGC